MSHEKKVQVCKSEESHIDRDFQNIRDRFDEEMKRMEDEMSRFRGSLLDHNREIDTRPLSPSSRRREMSTFVDKFESPLIRESSDGKCLKLKFDVTDYQPEEIFVKTVDNKLQVGRKKLRSICTHTIKNRKLTCAVSPLRSTRNMKRNPILKASSVNITENFFYLRASTRI